MTPFFHGLFFLCVLGAVVLASVSVGGGRPRRTGWRSAATVAVGFTGAVALVRPERLPEPVIVATLSACIAALQLVRPRNTLPVALFGGALAGVSASLLQVYGLPAGIALPLAVFSPAVAMLLAVRVPDFAPTDLQEEALLGLLAFSLLTALVPVMAAGWQSASALNLVGGPKVDFALPAWTLTLAIVSIFLGGAYATWRRR